MPISNRDNENASLQGALLNAAAPAKEMAATPSQTQIIPSSPIVTYTGKKPKRRRRFSIVPVLLIFLALLMLIVFLEKRLQPKMVALAESEAKGLITRICTETVLELGEQGEISYEKLTQMGFDRSGRLVSVNCNTAEINRIGALILSRLEQRLESENRLTIKLPLGTITGGYLFAGTGIPIPVRIVPEGAVTGEVQSELLSRGINQTCHKIGLQLQIEIIAALPGKDGQVNLDLTLPLCESIYLGEVPEVYLSPGK